MENLWHDFLNFIRKKGVIVPEPQQIVQLLDQPQKQMFKTPIYETITYDFKNKQITGQFIVINESFKGFISDMYIYIPNTSGDNMLFSVEIMADGAPVYQDTFSNFVLRSDYSTDLTSFNDTIGNNYVFQTNSIYFDKNIYVRIYGITTPITFTQIYAKVLRTTFI